MVEEEVVVVDGGRRRSTKVPAGMGKLEPLGFEQGGMVFRGRDCTFSVAGCQTAMHSIAKGKE